MSTFQNAIAFFVNLGVYDVVLPFLLIFTIVFAMLEKSKVLGLEDKDGAKVTKKNLNAMVAFVAGFLTIASTELVRTINVVIANSMLLLLLAVLFMMLAGSFHGDQEFKLGKGWRGFFMVVMFVGIVLIFLHALGWLQTLWRYMITHLDGPVVGSFLLLIIVLAGMYWISGGNFGVKSSGSGDSGKD